MKKVLENSPCSLCGSLGSLAPSNISRKTGEQLYRSWCLSCEKARKQLWVKKHAEHVSKKNLSYAKAHPDKIKEIAKRWKEVNPERSRELRRQMKARNPQKYRAEVSARRKRVRQNTPLWSNSRDLVFFYSQCPKGFHVDHIILLNGKKVSGLHVLNNLQYLPAKDNMSKGNKYGIDC